MGQQQLLLLVLATVIVGLATVAGIQAFDENQQQAAQDALTQRAVSYASDIKSSVSKPAQLGGIDTTSDGNATVAASIGLDSTVVTLDGVSGFAQCGISSSDVTRVVCQSSELQSDVRADFQGDDIETTFGSYTMPSSSAAGSGS